MRKTLTHVEIDPDEVSESLTGVDVHDRRLLEPISLNHLLRTDPRRTLVAYFLREAPGQGEVTPGEVADATGLSPETVADALDVLELFAVVERAGGDWYDGLPAPIRPLLKAADDYGDSDARPAYRPPDGPGVYELLGRVDDRLTGADDPDDPPAIARLFGTRARRFLVEYFLVDAPYDRPMAVGDLHAATGLSRTAIEGAVEHLVARGLVVDTGSDPYRYKQPVDSETFDLLYDLLQAATAAYQRSTGTGDPRRN